MKSLYDGVSFIFNNIMSKSYICVTTNPNAPTRHEVCNKSYFCFFQIKRSQKNAGGEKNLYPTEKRRWLEGALTKIIQC